MFLWQKYDKIHAFSNKTTTNTKKYKKAKEKVK